MNEAIMKSVNPKDCELIASGKKTVLISKTKPKLETPFKVYIYCTQGGDSLYAVNGAVQKPNSIHLDLQQNSIIDELNGKVIGEFVCNGIEVDDLYMTQFYQGFYDKSACLNQQDLINYGQGKRLYFWHISDLVIYDKPRELSKFWSADKCPYASKDGCTYQYHCFRAGETKRCGDTLSKPPRNWCYIKDE